MARHKRKSRQESATAASAVSAATITEWSPDNAKVLAAPVGVRLPSVTTTSPTAQDDQDHVKHDMQVPSSPATKKRKKRKSKGKSKKKFKSLSAATQQVVPVDSDNNDSEDEDATPLEGTMMGDTMVLLDRNKGVVYSAEERLENGTRKQIGTILANGTIQVLPGTHQGQSACGDATTTNTTNTRTTNHEEPQFPFATDPDDHCESPMDAYQDIVPFLHAYQEQLRRRNNKSTQVRNLQIYDPYYCNGAVRRNLASLGFPDVYNEKEDCYQVWDTPSRYPNFDILITNPPYSGDHMERLIQHLTSSSSLFGGGRDRPWMLLLPQWVHKKEYFLQGMKQLGIQPFYLVPQKRYVYVPPPSFRESKKSDVHKKSSPFVSMWYIWGGSQHHEAWLSLTQTNPILRSNCQVARSKNALRDLRRQKKN